MGDLKAEIDGIHAKWGELMRAKNIDALADMYTTDCRYMPPGSPVLIGQEEVKKLYKGFFDAGATDGRIVTEEVGPCGDDTVFMRGVYDVWKADGSLLERGKVVMIFKRQDGNLKIYIDIDNTFE